MTSFDRCLWTTALAPGADFDEDYRRLRRAGLPGELIPRFTHTQVIDEPDWVLPRLAEAILIIKARQRARFA